ncbi:MAG: UDP-N-acetyl-D-glucosamine dehydrogenase [Acidobacteria bacterium]|nr:MAG: UDP-N-acetyl-D-glucosamine dehydrogenase [Acidobacteriota bacterium]
MSSPAQQLLNHIQTRRARVGVIGLGYVGLPLAVEFARNGFATTGIDLDSRKIESIGRGTSYIPDVPSAEVARLVSNRQLRATADFSAIATLDTINICVPTPLRKTKDPDMSYIVSAVEAVAAHLHAGMLIVLESTTYPGTTEELVRPMLEATGLRAGVDFFLAFSPERVDPGNPKFNTHNVPKVVGGIDAESTELAAALYAAAIATIVPVGSTQVAEMVKLLENTFRAVNIGIPIDPFYLSWKAKQSGFDPRFIELAGQINASMPHFVVDKIADALNRHRKPLNGSTVLVLGVAYKRDIDDIRESPSLDVMTLLHRKGATVLYADPHVPTVSARSWSGGFELHGETITPESLTQADCVAILTDHQAVDYGMVLRSARLIVDTRNAVAAQHPKVLKLGAPSAALDSAAAVPVEKAVA